jgi:hypothetical protein
MLEEVSDYTLIVTIDIKKRGNLKTPPHLPVSAKIPHKTG